MVFQIFRQIDSRPGPLAADQESFAAVGRFTQRSFLIDNAHKAMTWDIYIYGGEAKVI